MDRDDPGSVEPGDEAVIVVDLQDQALQGFQIVDVKGGSEEEGADASFELGAIVIISEAEARQSALPAAGVEPGLAPPGGGTCTFRQPAQVAPLLVEIEDRRADLDARIGAQELLLRWEAQILAGAV